MQSGTLRGWEPTLRLELLNGSLLRAGIRGDLRRAAVNSRSVSVDRISCNLMGMVAMSFFFEVSGIRRSLDDSGNRPRVFLHDTQFVMVADET